METKIAKLLSDLDDQIEWVEERQAWVCYDNNPATAQQVKQLHPHDPVLLYNRDTGEYTRFYIAITVRKPHMHNGEFVYEEETIKI